MQQFCLILILIILGPVQNGFAVYPLPRFKIENPAATAWRSHSIVAVRLEQGVIKTTDEDDRTRQDYHGLWAHRYGALVADLYGFNGLIGKKGNPANKELRTQQSYGHGAIGVNVNDYLAIGVSRSLKQEDTSLAHREHNKDTWGFSAKFGYFYMSWANERNVETDGLVGFKYSSNLVGVGLKAGNAFSVAWGRWDRPNQSSGNITHLEREQTALTMNINAWGVDLENKQWRNQGMPTNREQTFTINHTVEQGLYLRSGIKKSADKSKSSSESSYLIFLGWNY